MPVAEKEIIGYIDILNCQNKWLASQLHVFDDNFFKDSKNLLLYYFYKFYSEIIKRSM